MAFYKSDPETLGRIRKGQLKKPAAGGTAATTTGDVRGTCETQKGNCERKCYNAQRQERIRGGEFNIDECLAKCDDNYQRCLEAGRLGTETEEEEEPAAGCPPEAEAAGDRNEPHEGCQCGSRFAVPSADFTCPSGYKMVIGSSGPSCRCIKWCNDMGLGEACVGKGTETLGEYKWPSELVNLYNRLMGRAGEYLSRKPGYSQAAIEAIYGKGYENIRNLEQARRQQAIADLQREGMLGTGAGMAALRQIPWQTEQNVSDVIRDVFLGQEAPKRTDLASYTDIAQSLFGKGMNYQQILEAINAARRGEAQNALALWMQYLTNLMSSWAR